MREIKFRAWHEVSGMKYFRFVDIENFEDPAYTETYPTVCFNDGDYRPLRDCIVMQYTGRKDKNGKEIYGGDIFKAQHIFGETIGTVKWIDERSGFYPFVDNEDESADQITIEKIEIIGNICENPELFEAGSGEQNGEPKSQVSE